MRIFFFRIQKSILIIILTSSFSLNDHFVYEFTKFSKKQQIRSLVTMDVFISAICLVPGTTIWPFVKAREKEHNNNSLDGIFDFCCFLWQRFAMQSYWMSILRHLCSNTNNNQYQIIWIYFIEANILVWTEIFQWKLKRMHGRQNKAGQMIRFTLFFFLFLVYYRL